MAASASRPVVRARPAVPVRVWPPGAVRAHAVRVEQLLPSLRPLQRTCHSEQGRAGCPGPITLLRLLGRSAVCTGSPVAGDCGGLGDTGPYAVRIPSSESPRVVGLSSWAATGPACRQWDLAPGQPHAGPRGRAPALLTVAGVASQRVQARQQLLDSDGVGPDGAGRPDSDGDSGAGSDYGPARTRCHVSPRSRTRLAVNVSLVPALRASRPPASLH